MQSQAHVDGETGESIPEEVCAMLGLQEGVRSTARFWLLMLVDYSKRLVAQL